MMGRNYSRDWPKAIRQRPIHTSTRSTAGMSVIDIWYFDYFFSAGMPVIDQSLCTFQTQTHPCADWEPWLCWGDSLPRVLPSRFEALWQKYIVSTSSFLLEGSAIHLHLAKRMLKHFPLLLNDIYLSDEWEKMHGITVTKMSLTADTTVRMCCTWAVWPRTPPLSSGYSTLEPTLTGAGKMLVWFTLLKTKNNQGR